MSKAYLVIDMPKNCLVCPLGKNKSTPLEQAVVCSINGKWAMDKECDSRPDWCLLKELPQKKDIKKAVNMTSLGWIEGYNACVDEIVKEYRERMCRNGVR